MFKAQWTTPTSVDEALRALPSTATVYVLDEAWLVVAPSGIVVLTEDRGDLTSAALRAAEMADAVRSRLSEELAWVPFVDAMCATTVVGFDPDQPCLVVPADLVEFSVTGGPRSIDAETLDKLRLLPYPTLR